MIEFRRNSEGVYELFIDGILIEEDEARLTNRIVKDGDEDSIQKFHISPRTEESKNKLLSHSFSELPSPHVVIDFFGELDWEKGLVSISFQPSPEDESYQIHIGMMWAGNWRRVYSFADYCLEMGRLLKDANNPELKPSLPDLLNVDEKILGVLSTFNVICSPASPHLPMGDEYARLTGLLGEFHKEAVRTLNSRIHSESVMMYFDFPEEVRVPCEQYLLYFGQFLKDLGVEAKAEIEHKAGQVLFAVTPADKQTALDKIRTALETYLQLPANPAAGEASLIEYEIAAQRLAANVDHLKGQLRLAHAELRLAGATMQAQQVTIDRLMSGDVIIESLKDVTPKPKEEDKEELLGGTVALTKTNWKGVEFNLPEIFRRLRRMFKEDE